MPPPPPPADLIRSLESETCPACGDAKRRAQTLCYRCYKRLPRRMQHDLYRLLGDGYEEAVAAALAHLKAPEFIQP